MLLAVDDVQWLDPASEQALAFAARRLPPRIGLLLTRRVEGRRRAAARARARAAGRIGSSASSPGPLSLAALHHLISGRLGTSLPRPLLVRLAAASGGNPFFALEIARALGRDAGERASGEPLPVPRERSRSSWRHGSRALSADAAAGRARRRGALPPDGRHGRGGVRGEGDARAALIEAEDAGVLVTERDRIRFTHPLLASAVYGSASHERRRQLHERLATVVVRSPRSVHATWR